MSAFDPLPLLSNPHVQTVLGNLLPPRQRPVRSVKRVVALPDGDAIVLHETPPLADTPRPSWGEGPGVTGRPPLAVLIHGLGGSHLSPYMLRMTQRLTALGWHVFRMDLRAAGAGLRLARRFYNAACSPDVGAVVEHLAAAFPHAPVAIVGFSLGGNIVLKYAGEIGDRPPPTVCAVATLAPPIDLLRCSAMITHHPLYDAFFVRHLTTQVALHEEAFPELPRIVFPRRTTLRQFDELYTAPRWGYADALDYYRRASAQRWIGAIRVPTFILTARDDPFVAVEPFEVLRPAPSVEVHISTRGGHLGFLGPDGAGGFRWAETQLVNWLTTRMGV